MFDPRRGHHYKKGIKQMTKVIISTSYGAGFHFTNELVFNWLNEHGGEGLVIAMPSLTQGDWYHFARQSLRYHPLVVQCIEELGRDATGYAIAEYDEILYDVEIKDYDGLEWIELVPILDVELMTEMSAEDLAAYLDEKGIKHNYLR